MISLTTIFFGGFTYKINLYQIVVDFNQIVTYCDEIVIFRGL